mmetsp:Transcript_9110/g.20266  ORF Transcript_9110/g.20266 Transcript_9110/m.20266 type:complete len:628 (+) Transcript_9110:84-1967(+)
MAELLQFLEQAQSGQGSYQDALVLHILQAEQTLQKEETAVEIDVLQSLASSLCIWLRTNEEKLELRSVLAVLRLITKIIGKDPATDSQFLQSGLVTSITSLLRRETNSPLAGSDTRLVRALLEVLACIGVVEESDSLINKAGTVASVVTLLDKKQGALDILEDGLTCLALLAKRTRHRRSLQAESRLPILLEAVKAQQDVPAVLIALCRFFKAFSIKEDCCVALLHSGGMDILLATFKKLRSTPNSLPKGNLSEESQKKQLELWVAVLVAIWSVSCDATEVQMSLWEGGFFASLVSLLQEQPEHGDIVEACLGIARSPCKLTSLREEIISMGFLQLSIDNLRRWPQHMGVQKEACGIIGNLAVDEEIRKRIGKTGAIEEVVNALSRCSSMEDRKTAKLACGALVNLASSSDNREILSNTDVVRVLLYTMQLYITNENVLEYGIIMISHLAVQQACNEKLFEAGAVSALFLFCHQHSEDINLLSRSLAALRHIARYCGGLEDELATVAMLNHIAHAGQEEGFNGLQLMVRMMQMHQYETVIIRECSLLFTGMTRDKACINALMEITMKTCTKALEIHKGDEATATALVEFLAQLPVEDKDDFEAATASPMSLGDAWSSENKAGLSSAA